jgi:DNA-binding XRE family transcriptional regulator
MRDRGVGNGQLAAFVDVTHTTVRRWREDESIPEPAHCVRLAEYFHVPLGAIYKLVGYPTEGDVDPAAYDITEQTARVRSLFEEGLEILRRIEARQAGSRSP